MDFGSDSKATDKALLMALTIVMLSVGPDGGLPMRNGPDFSFFGSTAGIGPSKSLNLLMLYSVGCSLTCFSMKAHCSVKFQVSSSYVSLKLSSNGGFFFASPALNAAMIASFVSVRRASSFAVSQAPWALRNAPNLGSGPSALSSATLASSSFRYADASSEVVWSPIRYVISSSKIGRLSSIHLRLASFVALKIATMSLPSTRIVGMPKAGPLPAMPSPPY
mmetsp:Transcript_48000/g.112040  ORF Transcript_48000/g.112040 Transcript_48000/m.112040 type:complete len:221 (+) Transcript_48000:1013-1675(+)